MTLAEMPVLYWETLLERPTPCDFDHELAPECICSGHGTWLAVAVCGRRLLVCDNARVHMEEAMIGGWMHSYCGMTDPLHFRFTSI